jgi:hypothetical protein
MSKVTYNEQGFVPFYSTVKLKYKKMNNIQNSNSDVSAENGTKPNVVGSQSRETDKLITLNDFVDNIKDYVNESHSIERGLQLIFAYNNFLNQPINEEMFTGKNPLFEGFRNIMQSEALKYQIKKSFQKDKNGSFSVCVYRTIEEPEISRRTTYVTSFHLKTVNDLVGKIEEYNSFNEQFGWRDVS